MIRTIAKNNSHDSALLTSDLILEGAMESENTAFSHHGSFILPTLRLYEIKTEVIISLIQSVTLPAYCIVKTNAGMEFSANNKTLAVFSDTSVEDDA